MNTECDLTKKFDEMFSDELVLTAFFEWNKKRLDKNKKWYDDFIPAFVIAFAIALCLGLAAFMLRDRVEQKVSKYLDKTFVTYVWVDGKIVKSWYTPIPKVTDSLLNAQKQEGEKLIKTLNK